jgi:hypothetical protein
MPSGIAIEGKRSLHVRVVDGHHLVKGEIRDTQ